jgi:hypothetical protein
MGVSWRRSRVMKKGQKRKTKPEFGDEEGDHNERE